MICLLLIMTVIFINSTESAEQKIRHSDTLLQEEDMTAKTKIWLLMVESGKVDEEELRKITPKSIFIAPLLTSRTEKCKEGYRHDHLGQCVKVIKIDPKVQLELLLQRLNKLYGEKKEEGKEEQKEEEEKKKETEVSNGPLHFSLPISVFNEKTEKENNETNIETPKEDLNFNENFNDTKTETTPEFIPIPWPMIYQNETAEIKDIESSGAEPLNVTEPTEISEFEGSGDELVASGDGYFEEATTTSLPVSILPEETDYLDMGETESTTVEESQYTETPLLEELSSTISNTTEEVSSSESYQNTTDTPSVNDISGVIPKEKIQVHEDNIVSNKSKSDKIIFPSDVDDVDNHNEELRTPIKSSTENSRIRFPDEISQPNTPSHLSFPDLSSKSNRFQTHSSVIPREEFWWLPKNWRIDENQQKSPSFKVWSRLPLIHDISYSRETSEGFKKSGYPEHTQIFSPQHKDKDKGFKISLDKQQQPPSRNVKPFRSSRFQDVILTPRQNFRLQR